MRWKQTVMILVSLLVAGLAGSLMSPGARMFFRSNRIIYLERNAHRYQEALQEYTRLRADFPRTPPRLSGTFLGEMVENARVYYRQKNDPASQREYELFLDSIERRPELASLARRLRLELRVRQKESAGILRAAREMLNHEGYSAEALWWATLNQYRQSDPCTIPKELLAYRARVEGPADSGAEKPTAEQATRALFLKALLALADRDWAEAASNFDQYRQRHPDGEPLDLAQGLALLNAGRPEAATQYLRAWRLTHPGDARGLAYLAQAYLTIGVYPWAAQVMHELREVDGRQEATVLTERFGPAAHGASPFLTLCAALSGEGVYRQDAALCNWLGIIARSEEERRAVDGAAGALIALAPQRPQDQAALLEYCLWRNQLDAARPLAAGVARDPADARRRQGLGRILQWYPARNQPQAVGPLQTQSLHRLLQHNSTERFRLTLPAGASWVVLMVQGYPARKVWPIVNVDLGEEGSRLFYVNDSRTQARPFLTALKTTPDQPRQIDAAISLLNGSEGAVDNRNVLIADVLVF